MIYDVNGGHVLTLASGHHDAGAHHVSWNGPDERGNRAASGVYLSRVRADGFDQTRKMQMVK